MANVIDELTLHEGLSTLGRTEHLSDFVCVEEFKKLKIATSADVILQINVEWSYDGKELDVGQRALITSYRTPSGMWRVEKIETMLPYCRIRVLNGTGANNDYFHMVVYGTRYFKHTAEPKEPDLPEVVLVIPHSPVIEKKKRAFGGAVASLRDVSLSRKSPGPSRHVEGKQTVASVDYRFPNFIPKGALMMGEKNGKVTILPRGVPGEYLMVNADGDVCWTLPYPPTK